MTLKVLGLSLIVLLVATIVLLDLAVYALAASAPETEGNGILAGGFLGFASLIVAVKLIPGIIRFASIIGEEGVEKAAEPNTARGKSSA